MEVTRGGPKVPQGLMGQAAAVVAFCIIRIEAERFPGLRQSIRIVLEL